MLQHHGAPTRLLDWTYSPAVAVHFALKHAADHPGANLAVWVISTEWCMEKSSEVCRAAGKPLSRLREPLQPDTEAEVALELLAGDFPPCVWPINPFRLNERLTLQQGLFLAPGDVSRSFADNLAALSGQTDPANVTYIPIPRAASGALLQELRDANVTDATLFPGLDGFSRSLWGAARFLNLTNQGFQDLVDPRAPKVRK